MTSHSILLRIAALAAVAVGSLPALAQPPAPPPKEFSVVLRYQINAFRNERVAQFREMVRYLESIGLQKDPAEEEEAEDPKATRLGGVVPAGSARKMLLERHVQTVLLIPRGADVPGDAEPVRVELELRSGLPLERQRILADQVRVVLKDLGFKEAVSYDHRGHVRLVGSLPAGRLATLLDDLRKQPSAQDLPAPFSTGSPLRLIEVQPQLPPPQERPTAMPLPAGQEKLTPELRELLADAAEAANPRRLEVILSTTPAADDREWRRDLEAQAPGWAIEGRAGPLVTVFGPAIQAIEAAALPTVSTVRIARAAKEVPPGGRLAPGGTARGGIDRLYTLDRTGSGQRVVVVGSDFRGWQEQVGNQLPKGTTYLDLTALRTRTLLPDDVPAAIPGLGLGTQQAIAIHRAAPSAELTLVRIDRAACHQLEEVARFINGEDVRSLTLEQRAQELVEDRQQLDRRREALATQRRAALDNVGAEDTFKARWDAYKAGQDEFDRDERVFQERVQRYLKIARELRGLKGVRVVACGLIWNEGQPHGGASWLSRYFDDRPFRAALWFQFLPDTRGQWWEGLFRDTDGNGLMEFAPVEKALPKDRWTRELNHLAWRPKDGETTPDLPAGAKLRFALQWREAHDPELWGRGEDHYREPLAKLQIVAVRQLDHKGETLPADTFEVAAHSVGLPQRLDNHANSSTYEQTLELTVKEPGRYAVRIEGQAPTSTRPASLPTLPSQEKSFELRPRLYVETLEGDGRAVLQDYATDETVRGIPGDAQRVIPVAPPQSGGVNR